MAKTIQVFGKIEQGEADDKIEASINSITEILKRNKLSISDNGGCEHSVIDTKELLEQREKEGKPLVIIEPSSSSKDVVDALKKLLPEDKKNAVVLVDLDKRPK